MEVVQLYLRLQLLLTIFLMVLLWALSLHLRQQPFFRWWACAWTSFGIFLVLRVLALQLPSWTVTSASLWLVVETLGFLQIPLLMLGAWSLLRSPVPGARLAALGLGSAAVVAGVVVAISFLLRENVAASVAVRFIPRMLCFAGALLFCGYVFARRWRQSRSWGSAIIAAFFLLCAMDRVGYVWIYFDHVLRHVSTPATLQSFGTILIGHPLLYFLDISCMCGICLGMVMLVVEEHQHTEHALTESHNQSRKLTASNVELQAEILERRRIEAALRESEDRYRDLVENSQDLLCTHDPQGKLLSVNPAPARILGYTVEELLRLSLPELIAPEFRPQFWEYIDRIVKEGEATGYLCLLTRGGERRIWEYHNTLRTEGVPAPIVRGLARDVTEQKLAERALRNREEQLRQAQKMDAIGRMAGGIAHDFNNFLLGITLNLEQALRQLGAHDVHLMDHLDQALNAALSAASLTRGLLTFSRRRGFQPQTINLNDVVITTKDLLDRLGGENIHINVSLQDDLAQVKSDPVQLQQVILNLMLNARDAMPSGGLITIRTENFELENIPAGEHFVSIPRPGAYVVLEVCDTGTGMDESTLSHLFEPFFTTKESSTSAGLGLPICYGIVTQSEGHISVRSQLGRGTTIRVYLPLTRESIAETPPPPAAIRAFPTLHRTRCKRCWWWTIRRWCATPWPGTCKASATPY